MFRWGGGGGVFLRGGVPHGGALVLVGRGGFEKNHKMGGCPPLLWETLHRRS